MILISTDTDFHRNVLSCHGMKKCRWLWPVDISVHVSTAAEICPTLAATVASGRRREQQATPCLTSTQPAKQISPVCVLLLPQQLVMS